MKQVQFQDLAIGDTFFCWGDIFINYNHPAWCECTKVSDSIAQEKDGVRFCIDGSDEVSVEG